MNTTVKFLSCLAGLCYAWGVACAADSPVSGGDVVGATWQPQKIKVSYVGFTTRFTCDGLENHVRNILLYLGARADAKVHATGCPGGPDRPSPTAWIDAEFQTLQPTDDASAKDLVQAYWAPRELSARRPAFMDAGDCELVDAMKQAISGSFALTNLEYRVDCTPHQLMLDDFKMTGRALVLLPDAKHIRR